MLLARIITIIIIIIIMMIIIMISFKLGKGGGP